MFAKSLYLKRSGPLKIMDLEVSFTSSNAYFFYSCKKMLINSKYFSYSLVFSYSESHPEIRQGLRFLTTASKSQVMSAVRQAGTSPMSDFGSSLWDLGVESAEGEKQPGLSFLKINRNLHLVCAECFYSYYYICFLRLRIFERIIPFYREKIKVQ